MQGATIVQPLLARNLFRTLPGPANSSDTQDTRQKTLTADSGKNKGA